MGLVKVSSGTGTVLGHSIINQGRQIRARVGYVPEDDCYIPGMTGVEVVQFAASLSGIPSLEALRRAHEILDFCGMQQERYRPIESFSTGMRQKIKFASAIVHDPDYLILDEPTSGLDPEEREQLLYRVKSLSTQSGKSVLLSTHILPDVQQVCDHVVILSRGQVRLNKTFEEINRPTSPTLTLTFLGDSRPFLNAAESAHVRAEMTSTGDIRIEGPAETLPQTAWKLAADTQSVIHSMRPARNSLEELFMAAIQESNHAHT
jgi:ABC-2 type transport system ATP-binding protein